MINSNIPSPPIARLDAKLRLAVVSIGRSGTSLISRILNDVLDVSFGEEADHIPRNHNNPDGYYENAAMLRLNERILTEVGAWVLTPPPVNFVHTVPEARRSLFTAEAHALIEQYGNRHSRFGWKDPRLSFTLPIWRAACPAVIPIIAFRNPSAVLSSIAAQLDRSPSSLTGLWTTYYRHIVLNTADMPRYFVSFDRILQSPTSEIAGLAAHLGISIESARLEKALSVIVRPQQSRHTAWQAEAAHQGVEPAAIDLFEYLNQCAIRGAQPEDKPLRELLGLQPMQGRAKH